MDKGPKQAFSQRKMANRYMKKCSTALIISKMQVKTTMRYHPIPLRMVILKKREQIAGEGVEKRGA